MCYDSEGDSSDREFMTYSEDEKYSQYILKIKEQDRIKEEHRKTEYERLEKEEKHIIFNLKGVNFMKFTYRKIKFCFQPSLVYKHISKKIIFYCSLRYLQRYKKWIIRREPMPARPLFLRVTSHQILINDNLEEIGKVIIRIFDELGKWSKEEIRYRRKKIEKYRSGDLCYLDLDSMDEELYLSDNERQVLFEKKKAVLKRMIPPSYPPKIHIQLRNPTRKYII